MRYNGNYYHILAMIYQIQSRLLVILVLRELGEVFTTNFATQSRSKHRARSLPPAFCIWWLSSSGSLLLNFFIFATINICSFNASVWFKRFPVLTAHQETESLIREGFYQIWSVNSYVLHATILINVRSQVIEFFWNVIYCNFYPLCVGIAIV